MKRQFLSTLPKRSQCWKEAAFDLVLDRPESARHVRPRLLKRIQTEYPDISVIIITGYGTVETAVAAIKAGAYDYITKPVHPDERCLVDRVWSDID